MVKVLAQLSFPLACHVTPLFWGRGAAHFWKQCCGQCSLPSSSVCHPHWLRTRVASATSRRSLLTPGDGRVTASVTERPLQFVSSPAGIQEDSVLVLSSKGPHCSTGHKSSSLLRLEAVGIRGRRGGLSLGWLRKLLQCLSWPQVGSAASTALLDGFSVQGEAFRSHRYYM